MEDKAKIKERGVKIEALKIKIEKLKQNCKGFNDFYEFKKRSWAKDTECEITYKDGAIMPIILNATAIKDMKKSYIRSRAAMVDATDRKRSGGFPEKRGR